MFALRSARATVSKTPLQSVLASVRYNSTEAELNSASVVQGWKSSSKAVQRDSQVKQVIDAPAVLRGTKLIDQKDIVDPREVARGLQVTGPIAGRMVRVDNNDIGRAFRQLRSVVTSNNIRFDKQQQRYYKKPGKVLEEKQIRRKKRLFDEGIRRLMGIVKEAKRRGY